MAGPRHALTLTSKSQRSIINPNPRVTPYIIFCTFLICTCLPWCEKVKGQRHKVIKWQQVQSIARRGSASRYDCTFLELIEFGARLLGPYIVQEKWSREFRAARTVRQCAVLLKSKLTSNMHLIAANNCLKLENWDKISQVKWEKRNTVWLRIFLARQAPKNYEIRLM